MNKKRYLFISLIILSLLFIVSCKKAKITSIEISNDSILVMESKTYDLSNLKLNVKYSNNSQKTIQVTKDMITSGYESLNDYGTHEIIITYEGLSIKTIIVLKESKPILSSIELSKDATTSFIKGEVNLELVLLKLTYSNNSTKIISLKEEQIVGDTNVLDEIGIHTLKIKIDNVETTIDIEIKENVYVVDITLNEKAVTTFLEGEFDITKILLDVKYSDESQEQLQLTSSIIKDGAVDTNTPGEYQLLVEYKEKELTIIITIVESELKYFIFEKTTIDYEDCYAVSGYIGNQENVVIPSMYENLPVKVISKQAFYENDTIVKVTIPSTVEIIEEAAFYKSKKLKTIIIPSSVIEVEKYALTGIKTLYFESSSVDESWFNNQSSYAHLNVNIETITIAGDFEYYINSNNQVVLSNYYGASSKVEIPNTINNLEVDIIGGACFRGCSFMNELVMPNTIVEIENYGVAECTNLTNVVLSSNLQILGECAFRECNTLPHINLPSTLKQIKSNAFNMCQALQEMIIPKGVTYIGSYAFSWCIKVNKIYIPNTVEANCVGSCYSCSSATIYLEASSIPSNWETGWNMSNRPIVYNYVM